MDRNVQLHKNGGQTYWTKTFPGILRDSFSKDISFQPNSV